MLFLKEIKEFSKLGKLTRYEDDTLRNDTWCETQVYRNDKGNWFYRYITHHYDGLEHGVRQTIEASDIMEKIEGELTIKRYENLLKKKKLKELENDMIIRFSNLHCWEYATKELGIKYKTKIDAFNLYYKKLKQEGKR